ncbi:MAG: formate C-acetyltransferase [Proteobacteria bacterium]|nr:MAG: formate C-acetyltransferase [Pseudomonadota bacterium]
MLNNTVINEGSWAGFVNGDWCDKVDVVDFIRKNVTPYHGDNKFLAPATEKTSILWDKVSELIKQERANGGVLDADAHTPSSITAHDAGYINQELETVVGLQTDAPLRRAIMPYGGLKMVENGLKAYGFESDPEVAEIFTKYRKTHNQGVFDVYTKEMLACRKSGVITGLPDAYGRGRIIGDYRRVALYGVDYLMAERFEIFNSSADLAMTEDVIRQREETTEQYRALADLKTMAAKYGFDISKPASNAREAIQWVYFAYLAAIKQQNGAAMSIGRVSTFLDIYFERDLRNGLITESEVQELMDHFVMKLRMVRFLRTPEYDQLFSGDPVWVTEAIGGMCEDGRTFVTKNSYRMIHTLYNIGAAPEPNLTVLWSESMPEHFKTFCAQASIDTSSLQYENDDLMRPKFGDDYAIACCVSAMRVGKQMQFFGARANLAKTLLYAINGGRDEKSGAQVAPATHEQITDEYLDYDKVMAKFDQMMDWLAKVYVNSLNVIHYMHDKYSYESLQMALHDKEVYRTLACGIAGLSVCADSLSAIKYAKVKAIRNEDGLVYDYEVEGDFPRYGNNDDRVDMLAANLVTTFMNKVRKHPTYRGSVHTQSVLTITSNVVYGKKTGNTPDGRKAGEPFAPGANPMHGRDTRGAIASLSSVAKLPYNDAEDGISYTFAILPNALGKTADIKSENLAGLMDGYFNDHGHHLNINVFNRETLLDAMDHPEKYPQLTIRVSGYAVNFIKLTREQQLDVIARTMHTKF